MKKWLAMLVAIGKPERRVEVTTSGPVLEVSTAVNEEAFHRAREVSDMGPGIYNLFREDIEKSKYEGETKGRKEEREFILKDMVSLGMITQDQADAYRNSRLVERTYEKD